MQQKMGKQWVSKLNCRAPQQQTNEERKKAYNVKVFIWTSMPKKNKERKGKKKQNIDTCTTD